MADAVETRTFAAPCEIREDAGSVTLQGYASTFHDWYDVGPFKERVAPQAFERTLKNSPDVRLLIDHDGQPLARTKSGTLELVPDDRGLMVRAQLDMSDPDVQRLVPKMRRGDLDQMSFAFRIPAGGDEWSSDYTERTLNEVNMSGGDVSVVTYPANPNTSVSVRSLSIRSAACTFVETITREIRAGKTISAANMTRLQDVLTALATADEALDSAQATVAEILNVPNPDEAEPVANAANLDLIKRRLTLLSL